MTKTTALLVLHVRARWYRARQILQFAWILGKLLQKFHRDTWRQFVGGARQIWRGGA